MDTELAERDTPEQSVSREPDIPQSPPVLPLSSQATPTGAEASSSQEEATIVTEKMNSWQVSSMPEHQQYFCLDVSQSGLIHSAPHIKQPDIHLI